MAAVERDWQVVPRARYMSKRFDRRRFNPDSNADHYFTLATLRTVGRSRARHYCNNICWPNWPVGRKHDADHFWCCASNALKALANESFTDLRARGLEGEEIYIDVGAGDSPDVLIASAFGYRAYSVDLFPPLPYSPVHEALNRSDRKFYVKADAVALPFDDYSADYITSQAMIDLIGIHERFDFYREVCRVLKVGGVFSMTGAALKCGHGFTQGEENLRARRVGWWDVTPTINGFRAVRTG